MSSTFYGLNIGASGLNAATVCVNTTANNVSNANTKGYTRQITNLQAAGALRNYSYGTLGGGVRAESVTQMRNNYYDFKYWYNNSYAGQYEKKIYYTEQIQNVFTDFDTTEGFSTIYNKMFNSLESLKGDGANENIRTEYIHNTQALMDYFNNVSNSLKSIQSDCNQEVKALVSQVNAIARKISVLNEKINTLEIQGTYANELRDERALLIDELSGIVAVETEELEVQNSNYPDMYTGATIFRVRIDGQLLVDATNYNELEVYSREKKVHQTDVDGLYDIRWSMTKNDFNAAGDTMAGQLKAVLDVRDGNNKENLQGTLESYRGHTITVKNPNITTIEAMNMPDAGIITIGSKEYEYSGFTMTTVTDGEGNSTCTYQFTLVSDDLGTLGGLIGGPVRIGRSVDAKGIPYYQTQMNEFLRSFCQKMNNLQQFGSIEDTGVDSMYGVDANGNKMGAFLISNMPNGTENTFEDYTGEVLVAGSITTTTYKSTDNSYYLMTAENVSVNEKSLKNPIYFATSARTDLEESKAEIVDEMLKLRDDVVLYRGSGGTKFLEYITSDVSVDVNEADVLCTNFQNISETINNYRMSVSSVDEDEEALDLVKFQNAYNLASKVISVMSQMYDRLITQTGV